MSIAIWPHVTMEGMLAIVVTNAGNTAVSNLTSISGSVTWSVAGTPITPYGPVWNNTALDSPVVMWYPASPLNGSSVVTVTVPANTLNTALGGNTAITGASVLNEFGQLETVYGGLTAFGLRTMPLGAAVDGGMVNTAPTNYPMNLRYKTSIMSGISGATLTYDPSDATLPYSWTPTTGAISCVLANYVVSNGVEVGSGQDGYPVQPGTYVISWVDANAGGANELQAIMGGNGNVCTGIDASFPPTVGVKTYIGNRVVMTYNVAYKSIPNLTHGYNMDLGLQFKSSAGLWSSGGTITDLIIVGPGDTLAEVLANPYAITNNLITALTAANGNGPFTIRGVDMIATNGFGNFQDPADLVPLTQFSWGALRQPGVALSYARRYSNDPTMPNVSWYSQFLYNNKLGFDGAGDGTGKASGSWIDMTLRSNSTNNGAFLNPFAGQGNTAAIEFGTVSPHGYRSGDQIFFPVGGTAHPYVLPITGGATTAQPTVSVTNGSPNITFTSPTALLLNQPLVFGSDSTGQAYLATSSVTASGTVHITPSSANITFSVSQTLTTGQLITFGADATRGNYAILTGGTGTAFTLTAVYSGTLTPGTSNASSSFGLGTTTFTILPYYAGTTNTTSTCSVTAAVDISNVNQCAYVTGASTFVFGSLATLGVVSGTSTQAMTASYQGSPVQVPMTGVSIWTQFGFVAPYDFYALMAAQFPGSKLHLPLMLYMSDACCQAFADRLAAYMPANTEVILELMDEIWNNGFPGFIPVSVFGNMVALCAGSQAINDVYTNPSVPVALTTYQAYLVIAAHMWNVIQARFDTYGKGFKVIRAVGVQWTFSSYATQAVTFANAQSIPFDVAMIAPYINSPSGNTTFSEAYSTTGTNPGSASAAFIVEFTRYAFKYASTNWAFYSSNYDALQLYTVTGTKPLLVGYEGQIQSMAPTAALTHDCAYHPAMAACWDAMAQSWQDGNPTVPGSGLAWLTLYTLGPMWGNGSNPLNLWDIQIYGWQSAGDGTTNQFSTAQGGSPGDGKCYDISTTTGAITGNDSVMLSRMQSWFGAANPAPTPTPTPTPTSTGGYLLSTSLGLRVVAQSGQLYSVKPS